MSNPVEDLMKAGKRDYDEWPHGCVWTIGGVKFVEFDDSMKAIRRQHTTELAVARQLLIECDSWLITMRDVMTITRKGVSELETLRKRIAQFSLQNSEGMNSVTGEHSP